MSRSRPSGPTPERTLGRFDGALLAGLLICSALVTVFLLVGRAYWLAPATPVAEVPTATITPLPTAIVAIAGTTEPTATLPVPTNTPETIPTPRVEPLDLTGLFAGARFTVRGQGIPGQTIALYDNDLLVGTHVVEADGTWTIIIAQGLPIGEHRLVAVAIGLDGGRSEVAPVGFTIVGAAASPLTETVLPTASEIGPAATATPALPPTLPPTDTPTLPPTKSSPVPPTAIGLAVTEAVVLPSPTPSQMAATSPTPTLTVTQLPASLTSPGPTAKPTEAIATQTPSIEASPTEAPPTEALPTFQPTVVLTALGLLPTADQAAAAQPTTRPTNTPHPTGTPLPPTATPTETIAPSATPMPTEKPQPNAMPLPSPTPDGQGGGMGLLPAATPSSGGASLAAAESSSFSGWGEPGGSVTLLTEDGAVLATAPVDADGRWTVAPDPGALAESGPITAQLYDPAGIIVGELALREDTATHAPLLPVTGASRPGRAPVNGPALALLLGVALLLGGVLFHQAGRLLRLMELDSGSAPAAPRRANRKGTPSRRP